MIIEARNKPNLSLRFSFLIALKYMNFRDRFLHKGYSIWERPEKSTIYNIMKRRLSDICTTFVAFGRLVWKTVKHWWTNRSEKTRKLMRYAIIACALWIVGKGCYDLYDAFWGKCSWMTEYCSENVEVHFFNNNKKRLYNRETKKYTTPRMDWVVIEHGDDSIGVYARKNKRGYVNLNTGKIMINADNNDYERAWVFSEGIAAVMKDGKVGFINMNNETVIPFIFDYDTGCGMWDLGFVFHEGLCCMISADDKVGLINTSGEWVTEAEYDEIWIPNNHHRILIKDGKYGATNCAGQIIYPTEYEYIDILEDGFVLTKDGRRWQEDRDGKTVVDFMFDYTCDLFYPENSFSTNERVEYYSPFLSYGVMGRYGILNRNTGKVITPAIYHEIEQLSYTLFRVQTESMDWILLDTNGNVVGNR